MFFFLEAEVERQLIPILLGTIDGYIIIYFFKRNQLISAKVCMGMRVTFSRESFQHSRVSVLANQLVFKQEKLDGITSPLKSKDIYN